MRKAFTILLFTFMAVLPLAGQRYSVTGEFYVAPKHEVSLGYGIYPATDISGVVSGFFGSKYGVDFEDSSLSGVLNFSYLYRITDRIYAGGLVAYSKMAGTIKDSGEGSKTYYSIMPQGKWNWFESGMVTLYSRLALGATVLKFDRSYDDDTMKDTSDTKVTFMFQASPIGMELGRMIAGYLEAGFGATGVVQAGIRCKF